MLLHELARRLAMRSGRLVTPLDVLSILRNVRDLASIFIRGQPPDLLAALVPPTLYYGKVGIELGKLVAHNRKMSPP